MGIPLLMILFGVALYGAGWFSDGGRLGMALALLGSGSFGLGLVALCYAVQDAGIVTT